MTDTTKVLPAERSVFWRFKGDKQWKQGYVRWVKGRMAEIAGLMDETVVATDEIEWEPNE